MNFMKNEVVRMFYKHFPALFCSVFGFSEFFNEEYLMNILSWRNINGCFTATIKTNKSSIQDCYSHINSLGIAFLCNVLRM